MKEKTFFQKFIDSALIVSFPAVIVGVLGPLEIFTGNYSELFFGTGDFFWMFIGISLLVTCVISFILALFKENLRITFHMIIFAFTLMMYVQNMFLNRQLMKTDGSKMDWGMYRTYTIVDTVVWVIAIMTIIEALNILKDKREQIMKYITGFIVLVQLVTVVTLMFTLPYTVTQDKMYTLSSDKEFSLASKENIIVLILDRYGNITFDNGADDNPEFFDIYKDFTYYNNANSKYNYTFPAIPYMLTLEDPDCTITTNEYKKRAWTEGKSKEIHDKLNENGYSYNLYTGSGRAVYLDASYLKGSIDNVEEASNISYKLDYGEMFYLFAKTSLYKYAPYIVKPYLEVQSFYFDGITSFEGVSACIESNASYYEALCNKGLSIDDSMEKAVIITHLSGVHTPFDINEKGEKVPESETDIKKVRLGINLMLEKYFDELKRLDLYDSSTIIITADHGQYKDALDPQPIYLIKPAGQVMDKMGYNKAPISSEDFIPTIIYLAGQDASVYGTSIFEIFEDEERERKCCFPGKGFEVYTYTGDKEVLRNEIENGKYTRIDATEDWD